MSSITIIQGEGKDVTFTYTESSVAIDVSSDTFEMVIKSTLGGTILLTKVDATFTKTSGASGIVSTNITATESAGIAAGEYKGQIERIATASTDVDREIFDFIISEDV